MAIIDIKNATVSAADPPIATNPNPDLAIKAPVRVATTGSNITLTGLQTIDGVSLNAGDRVLVKDQTDQTTNGLYNAATSAWTRTIDTQNNSQWAQGVEVNVPNGAINVNTIWQLSTANPITLGTSTLTFRNINLVSLLNQPKSTNFWVNVTPAVVIQRVNDRMFLGAATDNDGNNTGNNAVKDWMETFHSNTTDVAQFAVLSTIGQIGILSATRSSDSSVSGSQGGISIASFAINDNTTVNNQTTYGVYVENHLLLNVTNGTSLGIEIDPVNRRAVVDITPNAMTPVGLTAALWLACGGGGVYSSLFDASVAIGIVNNSAAFRKGIVFENNALTVLSNSLSNAMEMAPNQAIVWDAPNGTNLSFIYSKQDNSGDVESMVFADGSIQFQNALGNGEFIVLVSATDVNGVAVAGSASGVGAVNIEALGGDTNINMLLTPKGSGLVKFNNAASFTANGSGTVTISNLMPAGHTATIAKWLTFLDSGGTTSLIPVFQ